MRKKSKTTVIFILIFSVVLGGLGIGLAYYYYHQQNIAPVDTSAAQSDWCACYTVSEDDACVESRALTSKVIEKDNRTCQTICDNDVVPTGQKMCHLDKYPDPPRCNALIIKDGDGKVLTPPFDPDLYSSETPLVIQATFELYPEGNPPEIEASFKDFTFTINGEETIVSAQDVEDAGGVEDDSRIYHPKIGFGDFGNANTLSVTVSANITISGGNPVTGISGPLCNRTYDILQKKGITSGPLELTPVTGPSPLTLEEIRIPIHNLPEDDTVESMQITFNITSEIPDITRSLTTTLDSDAFREKFDGKAVVLDNEFLSNTSWTNPISKREESIDFPVSFDLSGTDLSQDVITINAGSTLKMSSKEKPEPKLESPASSITVTAGEPAYICDNFSVTSSSHPDSNRYFVTIDSVSFETGGLDNLSDTDEVHMKFVITKTQTSDTYGDYNTVNLYDPNNSSSIDGVVTLNSAFLDDDSNFVDNRSLPGLTVDDNSDSTTYNIDSTLYVNGNPISCGTDQVKVSATGATENSALNASGDDTSASSNFTVDKTGPECVERISPNNVAQFTITVTNNDSNDELVNQIVDKLPLGFSYIEDSSEVTLNGVSISINTEPTVTTTGNSSELTWEPEDGWGVEAEDTLQIQFSSLVGDNALTGDNLNEVVVTPANAPTDPATLRSEHSFIVAQNCSSPETGIFDSTENKIILGMLALLLGLIFYATSTGENISIVISQSGVGQLLKKPVGKARKFILKRTNPKQHFEESIKEKIHNRKKT